jgi:hypothetical protein
MGLRGGKTKAETTVANPDNIIHWAEVPTEPSGLPFITREANNASRKMGLRGGKTKAETTVANPDNIIHWAEVP